MAAQNLQSVPAELSPASAPAEGAAKSAPAEEDAAAAQRNADGQANFDRIMAEDSRIEPRDWMAVADWLHRGDELGHGQHSTAWCRPPRRDAQG